LQTQTPRGLDGTEMHFACLLHVLLVHLTEKGEQEKKQRIRILTKETQ